MMSDDLITLLVWGVTPVVGMLITMALAWRMHRFLASAVRVPGRIVRVESHLSA
jgi:hypothetical protein